jgi:hypothetical protein
MILETILHHIPCVQNFPVCGSSTLRNFHTGNLVLIWLIYGTSARSTVVRDRPGLTYVISLRDLRQFGMGQEGGLRLLTEFTVEATG